MTSKTVAELEERLNRIISQYRIGPDDAEWLRSMYWLAMNGQWEINTPEEVEEAGVSSMVFLGETYGDGSKKSFRCSCGANVFTRYGDTKFVCNGCQAHYIGEK